MKWLTWDQSAAIVVVSTVILLFARRSTHRHAAFAEAASRELAFTLGLYTIWRLARELPLASEEGAIDRARWIADFQEAVFLPSELAIQQWVVNYDWIADFVVGYYAIVHVPSLLTFLIWLFLFKRPHYARWRTGLAIATAGCLVIRFIRVAPPRFVPELGFVDLSVQLGMDVFGPVGTGVSDQFAAMPSIHVAWAAVVSFGIVAACRSPWRHLAHLHFIATCFVVAATGHHWWLDGIVAVALLGLGLWIDTIGRRWAARRRAAAAAVEGADHGEPVGLAETPVVGDAVVT